MKDTSGGNQEKKLTLAACLTIGLLSLVAVVPATAVLILLQRVLREVMGIFGLLGILRWILCLAGMVFVSPTIAGAIVGIGAGVGARIAKAHNPSLVGKVGATISLLVFVVVLVALSLMANVALFGVLGEMIRQSITAAGSAPWRFVATLAVVLIEAGCMMLGGWLGAFAIVSAPFCESCQRWKKHLAIHIPYKNLETVRTQVKEGKLASISELTAYEEDYTINVHVHYCPECYRGDAEFQVPRQMHPRDLKNEETEYEEITESFVTSREQVEALRTAIHDVNKTATPKS